MGGAACAENDPLLYRKRRVRAQKPVEPHTLATSRTCARLEAIHNERLD
jgi:hypothetical protein